MVNAALTALAVIAALYLCVVLLLAIFQRSFIYPAPPVEGRPAPEGFEQIALQTQDGLELAAGYRPARGGKPTVLYFHGNAADWPSSVAATQWLGASGYGVLAAEYRGYRGNPGKPSEDGLYADGRAAMAWLSAKGIAPSDVVIIGNSIGGGVATQIASETKPRALVLISTFASLPQVVGEQLRWLPAAPLVRDHFYNERKIADVDAPILLLHGDADTLIPDHHSRALAKANPAARLVIVEGAGHDLAWYPASAATIADFLESLNAED